MFNHSSSGSYEIARALDGYGSLVSETKLAEEILGTRKTFDMLVNNAGLIHFTQRGNFINLLKRGATIRIIIWDFSEANRAGYDAFSRAIGQEPEGNRKLALDLYNDLVAIRNDVEKDRRTYRGHFDFRINNRPLLYTLWIRDWDVPANTLGHISLQFYRGQDHWPSFRVSQRDGSKLLENMHEEFENAWRTSMEGQAFRP